MMKKVLMSFVALAAIAAAATGFSGTARAQSTVTLTDTITREWMGVTGTSYQLWEDVVSPATDAVYAGCSAGGNNAIQMRSTIASPGASGIVTTTSGGKVASVTVVWNSNTANNRTLQVYGKNSAYSAASDLYGGNAGTLLGTIVKGTSTSLTIEGDYEYIGLRSASGAMYLDEIQIVWNVPATGGNTGGGSNEPALYTVKLAPGTEDSTSWSFNPAEAATTGVAEGTVVNISYGGTRKVKSIEATVIPNGPSLSTPLTMEALSDGTVQIYNPKSGMQYTLNGGAKTAMTSDAINVTTGDKVALYGDGTNITNYQGTRIQNGTAQVKVYGNIMSLLDENGFDTATTLTTASVFYGLFQHNSTLIDASELLLPATTLTNSCYNSMFGYCTNLTAGPAELPATELAYSCYNSMFYYCSTLVAAPVLPATTLANYCYSYMFYGCSSLTAAPALPATTLFEYCYTSMFGSCTGLTAAPALPATTMADFCYANMFYGCSGLTTAPALPATTLAQGCYNSMFSSCTNLTAAPELPATTLANNCYTQMFYGCSGLTAAPALPATTLANNCYSYMFYGCSSLTAAPALPATTLTDYCYQQMFQGCSGLTAAPELPATTLATACYRQMFQGCTGLTAAPVLPAETLVSSCYNQMFRDCSNLSSVTCLATSLGASNTTNNWLNGVSATGTFTTPSATTWTEGSANGIPSGWTRQNYVDPNAPAVLTFNVAGHTFTYSAGQTWRQAIQNYATENAGWIVTSDYIQYGSERLWDGSTLTTIFADDPIDTSISFVLM